MHKQSFIIYKIFQEFFWKTFTGRIIGMIFGLFFPNRLIFFCEELNEDIQQAICLGILCYHGDIELYGEFAARSCL